MDPLDVAAPSKPFFDLATGAWTISRYSEVSAALRDPHLEAGVSDAEWHARYRQEAASLFGATARWESAIESTAAGCLSLLNGRVDVCEQVVRPWAAEVATIVTGVSGLQSFTADVFAGAADPFNADLKRKSDEATRVIASHFSGEFASLWVQAFVALSESLPAFVVNAWYTLLRSDSRVVNIDELLRYAAPSRMQLRRGAAGAAVLLNLASANRDPEVFSNPNVYDPQRSASRQLAFGSGPHSCLGVALIRAAASIGLRVFLSGPRGRILSYESAPGIALRSIRSLLIDFSNDEATAPSQNRPPRSSRAS
jgi:cytochrome P450